MSTPQKGSIEPLNDKVVIKPLKEDAVTPSGIVLPDTADKEKPMQGEVIAVGPGKMNHQTGTRDAMSVKVGDTVVFPKYSPDEFELGDEDYLIVEEEKILGIIRS